MFVELKIVTVLSTCQSVPTERIAVYDQVIYVDEFPETANKIKKFILDCPFVLN